jgi:glycosyltransferase involved in cell wall biosynthesis
MKSPHISVVLPTYNRGHVLPRAIGSVLRQTYQDFELLVIDDGSSDDTEKLISKYSDARIRYVKHARNLGQAPATNTGVRLALGTYISIIHSDDEWLPQMLEKIFSKFSMDRDVGCVYTQYGIVDIGGRVKLANDFSLEGYIYKDALAQGYITLPTTLSVRRTCFDVVGMFSQDNNVCMDDDMCFRLAKQFKFGLVREILGVVHVDAGGRISDHAANTADDYYKLFKKYSDEIIRYCGRKVMAKHYTTSGLLYLRARNRKRALRALLEGLNYGFSVRGVGGIALSVVPYYIYEKVRSMRHVLQNFVDSFRT